MPRADTDLLAQARGWALESQLSDGPDPARVRRAVNLRVIPPLFCVALLCLLDRVNLAFASLQMDADLGFSRAVYGLGSSLFFCGYLAQLPSAAACVALGARRWLTVILLVWGAVAVLFAAIQNAAGFLVLRLLLGLAEAGAFPSIMHQLSLFYDSRRIGQAYTWVTTATAAAGLLGGPLAAALMSLDGKLMAGWRWLFCIEGALPILLASVLWRWLPASPQTAAFLSPAEREWLWQSVHGRQEVELWQGDSGQPQFQVEQRQQEEQQQQQQQQPSALGSGNNTGVGAPPGSEGQHVTVEAVKLRANDRSSSKETEAAVLLDQPFSMSSAADGSSSGLRAALVAGVLDWRVWFLGCVMALIEFAMTSTHFWVPQLVKAAMNGGIADDDDDDETHSNDSGLRQVVRASLLSAIPFTLAAVAMVFNAHLSKRSGERHLHTAVPLFIAGLAFALLPLLAHGEHGALLALVALSAAAAGIWSTHGPFYSWPAAILGHGSATIGFAAVKTAGAVGSFCGPLAIGLLADRQHGFGGAMLLLASVCAVGGLLTLAFRPGERRDYQAMPDAARPSA